MKFIVSFQIQALWESYLSSMWARFNINSIQDSRPILKTNINLKIIIISHLYMRTFTLDQQCRNSKTVYMLYGIQLTGLARRLATQQVGYDQTEKINRGSANCSQTHNIIPLLVPDKFNVIIRTTTDELYPGQDSRPILTWHKIQDQYLFYTRFKTNINLTQDSRPISTWHRIQDQYQLDTRFKTNINLTQDSRPISILHKIQDAYQLDTRFKTNINLTQDSLEFMIGSMQDYNYIYAGCMELTLEVSCCKFPPDSEMESMWESNKEPLLQLLLQVHKGWYLKLQTM